MRRTHALALSLAALAFAPLCAAGPDDWELSDYNYGVSYRMGDAWSGPQLAITPAMLERVADVLGLDELQREEMMDLHAGLETQQLEAWVAFQEESDDVENRYTGWDYDWEEGQDDSQKMFERYDERCTEIADMLFEDLRLFLTREQEERWPLIEMERLRNRTLTKYGATEMERFDLVLIVQGLDLEDAERAALDPVLERYAEDLDEALGSRNRQLRNFDTALASYDEERRSLYDVDWSLPNASQLYEEAQQRDQALTKSLIKAALVSRPACERVGAVNTTYKQEIASLLSSADRAEFERVFEEAPDESQQWNPMAWSRARQKMQFMLSLEDQIVAWDAQNEASQTTSYGYSGYWGNGGGYGGWLDLARKAQPLSATQITRIERLVEELDEELETLNSSMPKLYEGYYGQQSAESIHLRSFEGDVTLTEKTEQDESEMMYYWDPDSISDEDKAEVDAWGTKRAEIEQRYTDKLREVLTLRQRAVMVTQ